MTRFSKKTFQPIDEEEKELMESIFFLKEKVNEVI